VNNDDEALGRRSPPRKEDVLFGPGDDWQTNTCITRWGATEYYRSGFRTAAFRLADHVCANGFEQDTLIYPIAYLYRHHTEMVLKNMIASAVDLLEYELSAADQKTLFGSHRLSDLWRIIRPLLDRVCALLENAPFPADDIDGIASYIEQIDAHDPDGQRFRYPKIRKKKPGAPKVTYVSDPSLTPELKLVNIRQFADCMEKLADYLEDIDGIFGHLREERAQMEHENHG
jgi:hypothetical protein